MNDWKSAIKNLAPGRVFLDAFLAPHTTFRTGGPADCLFLPATAAEFQQAAAILRAAQVPMTVIGNGSNLLVRDGGVEGCVVSFAAPMGKITVHGEKITAEAGALLHAVSLAAADGGLSGLEFAVGIPGSLGGAVFMNAGAYGGEIKDVVESVTAITPSGELRTFQKDETAFSYRRSVFQDNGAVIISAVLALQRGDRAAIKAKMREIQTRRKEKQPLGLPSAGSTFKRPPGHFAAALIEGAGLKGYRVGGAAVSEKHAGFVVNDRGGTAADVLAVIAAVQERVKAKFGVDLELEVKIIGREKGGVTK